MTKQEKLLSELSNVRDEFIEESDLTSEIPASRFRKRRILTVGIAAALVCSLTAVGAALVLNREDEAIAGDRLVFETRYIKHGDDRNEATARELKWDEKTIVQRYPEVQYKGVWYFESGDYTVGAGTVVPADLLGDKLGETLLVGKDTYTDIEHQINGELFGIRGIDPDCAIAVLMEGEDQAYVYIDHYYQPSTLGDLLDGLSLEENLVFGTVYYNFVRDGKYVNVEFPEVPAEEIWALFSDRNVPAASGSEVESVYYRKKMSVAVSVPLLGIRNMSLGVTEDGYITTNMMGQGHVFFVGTEKTDAFVQYVLTNCKGYEVVYITDGEDAEPEAGMEDGGIVTAVSSAAFPGNAASPEFADNAD